MPEGQASAKEAVRVRSSACWSLMRFRQSCAPLRHLGMSTCSGCEIVVQFTSVCALVHCCAVEHTHTRTDRWVTPGTGARTAQHRQTGMGGTVYGAGSGLGGLLDLVQSHSYQL